MHAFSTPKRLCQSVVFHDFEQRFNTTSNIPPSIATIPTTAAFFCHDPAFVILLFPVLFLNCALMCCVLLFSSSHCLILPSRVCPPVSRLSSDLCVCLYSLCAPYLSVRLKSCVSNPCDFQCFLVFVCGFMFLLALMILV